MGVIIRQSSYNILFILIGFTIGGISRLFILPNVLTTTQLGQLDILLNHALLLSLFFNLGASKTIVKFFEEFAGNSKKRLVSTMIFYPILLSLMMGSVLLMFPHWYSWLVESNTQPFLEKHINILVLIVVSQTAYYSFSGISYSLLKSTFPVFLSEVGQRMMVLSGVALYYFDVITYSELILFYGLVYLMVCLFIALSVRDHVYLKPVKLERSERKRVWNYSLFTTLDSGAINLVSRLDILMIGKELVSEYAGFYAIGMFIAQVVKMPARAIAPITTPLLAKAWTNNDMNEIRSIYFKSSLNQMILGGVIFIAIWCSIDEIEMLLPEQYRHIKYVVLWLGIGNLLNISAGVNTSIITTSSTYRANLYMNMLLLVLTFITNLILIPIYGIEGAAIATLSSLFIFNLIKFLFLKIRWDLQPYKWHQLTVLIIGGAAVGASYLIPDLSNILIVNLILNAGIYSGIFALLVYALRISDDLNDKINSLIGIKPPSNSDQSS